MMATSNSLKNKSPKNFKSLYKVSNSPESWKDRYRQRCFANLRRNRQTFLDRIRNCKVEEDDEEESSRNTSGIKDIMCQEWKLLKDEEDGLPDVLMEDDLKILSGDANDVEFMLSIFDEIQEELQREELKLVEEYEQSIKLEDEALCASIANMNTNDLICPMCKSFPLMLNKNIIFCKCGLRIDTEQDCISLEYIKTNIDDGLEQHHSQCEEDVMFGQMNVAGIDNLMMTCKACDFMHIVI